MTKWCACSMGETWSKKNRFPCEERNKSNRREKNKIYINKIMTVDVHKMTIVFLASLSVRFSHTRTKNEPFAQLRENYFFIGCLWTWRNMAFFSSSSAYSFIFLVLSFFFLFGNVDGMHVDCTIFSGARMPNKKKSN